MENDLEKLSLTAFVEISNTFTIWWATPETRQWIIKVNHCTYRDFEFELKGQSLADLVRESLQRIEAFKPEATEAL